VLRPAAKYRPEDAAKTSASTASKRTSSPGATETAEHCAKHAAETALLSAGSSNQVTGHQHRKYWQHALQ
jgi:hypothetical protein